MAFMQIRTLLRPWPALAEQGRTAYLTECGEVLNSGLPRFEGGWRLLLLLIRFSCLLGDSGACWTAGCSARRCCAPAWGGAGTKHRAYVIYAGRWLHTTRKTTHVAFCVARVRPMCSSHFEVTGYLCRLDQETKFGVHTDAACGWTRVPST